MDKPPLIRRVVIHNYKSIAHCDVTLGRFNVFVGRNGSGKSNFLDALQFVSDCLSTGSVSKAVELRERTEDVLRQSADRPSSFRVEISIQLPTGDVQYHVEFSAEPGGNCVVQEESLWSAGTDPKAPLELMFKCDRNGVSVPGKRDMIFPEVVNEHHNTFRDRLFLSVASFHSPFHPVDAALSTLKVYDPIPAIMRSPRPSGDAKVLREDGSNLTNTVSRLSRLRRVTLERIVEYLAQVVPGLIAVKPLEFGGRVILEFEQQIPGESQTRKFQSQNMSDGTLRSLAVLVAALQFYQHTDSSHVIGIEEPESAIHPAAMAVLLDALRESSVNNQILITTHSPDLLDRIDIETDSLFAVSDESGSTVIAPIDEASASAIRDHLYTPGELLRSNQLEPRIDAPSAEAVAE